MKTIKSIFKKINAIGVGTLLIGATIVGAGAQSLDLREYPAPFITDKKFNEETTFVVGRNAAATDGMAVLDIGMDLQRSAKVCSLKGKKIVTEGDAIAFSRPGDILELQEPLGEVRSTVTDKELDGLAGSIVTTRNGLTNYQQFIRFATSGSANLTAPKVIFAENDAPRSEVSDFLFIPEGDTPTSAFFEYELLFNEGLESSIDGKRLNDLEDEELMILGMPFTIISTKIDTTSKDLEIEMIGGANFALMEEGEVKTFTIEEREYKIEVMIIEDATPARVYLVINSEVVGPMIKGDTRRLKDGTLIGASKIILNEAGEPGLGDLVEVFVGVRRIVLNDNDYTATDESAAANFGFHQGVSIDNERIEDAWVKIKGNEITTSEFEINSITYRLTADARAGHKDIYVKPGSSVSAYLDEPLGMLGNWDIMYGGLDDIGVSRVEFDPAGDDEYNLRIENNRGEMYTFPVITNEGLFKFGDDKYDFVFVEGGSDGGQVTNYTVGARDYFILSNQRTGNGFDDTATSHILRYDSIDTSDRQLHLTDVTTGSKEVTYTSSDIPGTIGKANLIMGGNTYLVYIANVTGTSHPLAIDMNGDGSFNMDEIRFTTNGGGILDFTAGNINESIGVTMVYEEDNAVWSVTSESGSGISDSVNNVTLITLSKKFDEGHPASISVSSTNEELSFSIESRSNNKIGISTTDWISNGGFTLVNSDINKNEYVGMTDYGVHVELLNPQGTSKAETLTIDYPLAQRGANVVVIIGKATLKEHAEEDCVIEKIHPTYLFDDEAINIQDKPVILVGGPCINEAVARFTEFKTCQQFRESYGVGDAIVQLVKNGNNMAMLVAGYHGEDTRKAARKLISGEKLSGNFVEYSEG